MNVSATSTPDLWGAALKGVNAGLGMAADSASVIARQSVTATADAPTAAGSDNDLNRALVQQNEASHLIRANVKGLQVASQTTGALLNMMA